MLKMSAPPARAVGLITEYNPFHNGHLHHVRESRRVSGAEVVVAVMSGHFLQRGEPALVDKWVRAEMALRCGVDVVVELPFPWACSSAPDFARGAVQALTALGRVDSLCFGSEAGDLEALRGCADLLCDHEPLIRAETEKLLRAGVSYPEARARLLAAKAANPLSAAALAAPNNILGIEYLRALRLAGNPLHAFTVQRIGAGYHDQGLGEGPIASATAIRRALADGQDVISYLPEGAAGPLFEALAKGRALDPGHHLRLLLGRIIQGAEGLRSIFLVADGLENRLVSAADRAADLEDLVTAVKARQFTRTRIQRMLTYILNDVRSAQVTPLLGAGPRYLHLLGATPAGRVFLGACRKHLQLPLVGNFSRIHAILKRHYGEQSADYRLALAQLDLEQRTTRTFTLLMSRWSGANRNRDFFEPLRNG
ncbi:tRNA(Met) cytidine acetate ligase [Geoalkalibacter halelectricus]|uniref:tRNA(Met) cytidine acetate ligase n=1 Tax=Geoalkalibacter halelectricus TaxID=2847045 RepID=A0ABY5ZNI7_9BACT|nr:nucleotidyltransferase family protein [Geoalkalibacter halelectricus]MDO3379002.1 nucleotidyltransferase family protein [Geoalkalibacter halelectricus]UWZ78816.1 nucleotidyltransferase family protein [Geoalkalibacter halelectricus]